MNEDKNEKYIEWIVTIATLLFFTLLSSYAMRGCSSQSSLSGTELVSYLETGSVSKKSSKSDKDIKEETRLMDEVDESSDSAYTEVLDANESSDSAYTEVLDANESSDNAYTEVLDANESNEEESHEEETQKNEEQEEQIDNNSSKVIPVVVPVVPEIKKEVEKEEKSEAEEEAGIIADIENERISKSPYILKGVSFKTGSSILTKKSKRQLDSIAEALKKHKEVKINLRGHTDNRGSKKDNEILSTKRADSVGFALVERGVEIGNIWIQGVGELEPITVTAEEMARNRRVDIAVTD